MFDIIKLRSKIFQNTVIRRIFIIGFSCLSILGTAFSCSGLGIGNNIEPTYGILKKVPEVRQDGFVRANAVLQPDGQLNGQGLTNLSVLKIERVNQDLLYALTAEKGLFRTTDAGQTWQRVYIFSLRNDSAENIQADITRNDAFKISDFVINPNQNKILYLAGSQDGENVGKIYQSLDEGLTFQEIYTEVETGIEILFLAIDPKNPLRVFAVLEEGALLRSLDGGLTWQKIRNFRDKPIQIGFIPEFQEGFYMLFEKEGLATSIDGGENWNIRELRKSESQIGERQPEDGLDISFSEDSTFGRYEKVIPVSAGADFDPKTKQIIGSLSNESWLLIADRQMWYTESLDQSFKKLVLPVQSEQYELYDIAVNPIIGLNEIFVSVDSRLFFTRNRGQSWSAQDLIQVNDGNIGNIAQIIIENNNPEIIYLALVKEGVARENGIFVFE